MSLLLHHIIFYTDARTVYAQLRPRPAQALHRPVSSSSPSSLPANHAYSLAFLPRTLPDPNLETETEDPETDLLYFRSTNTQRTIESLHHLMRGLYPEDAMRVRVRVRNMQEENLVGNTVAYPRLGELLGGFARGGDLLFLPSHPESRCAMLTRANSGSLDVQPHPRPARRPALQVYRREPHPRRREPKCERGYGYCVPPFPFPHYLKLSSSPHLPDNSNADSWADRSAQRARTGSASRPSSRRKKSWN